MLTDKKKTKLVDVMKRDEEIFYSFGVTLDENFLILEGIEIESKETSVKIKKAKSRKKKGKKKEPSDDEYEMIETNKHVLYLWECGMDGEFTLKNQVDFDSVHHEHDFLTNIWCVQVPGKTNEHLVCGVTQFTQTFHSYKIKNGALEKYGEPIKLKDKGKFKCAKFFQNGFYCLGGDKYIHFAKINTEEDKKKHTASVAGDANVVSISSGKTKKTKGLSVGIKKRKKRRGGFL